MAGKSDSEAQPVNPAFGTPVAEGTPNLADLLVSKENGVFVSGIVLAVEEVKEFRGKSSKGNDYAFSVREFQVFTGNKSVTCKHQMDIGSVFPGLFVGMTGRFRVRAIRMNGAAPVFELEPGA